MDTSSEIDQVRELATMAYDPENSMHRPEALFKVITEALSDAGHFTSPQWSPLSFAVGRKSASVDGYDVDEEMGVLTLFRLLDCHEDRELQQHWEAVSCRTRDIERAIGEMEVLTEGVRIGEVPALDESSPADGLLKTVAEYLKMGDGHLSLCVLTTGELTKEGWKRSDSIKSHTNIWDATRICRALNNGAESLTIDFSPCKGINCLLSDDEHRHLLATGSGVLLAKIPGWFLADIYQEHRTRLLQQNVRAFLQFNGKVNKGIRDTIATEPHRFLSYNNGIAVTASEVVLERLDFGIYRLLQAKDFQIVNGGQTTASLMHSRLDKNKELDLIQVAMKMTIVRPEDMDELVPKISLFANSQNKVQESDFASNNPWLVKLEELSRRIEATKDEKSLGQSIQWYFERVRGQYKVDIAKQRTSAQQQAFKARHPARTKFGKTELARAALSWEGEPQVVSLGGQKCFAAFVRKLSAAREMAFDGTAIEPSDEDFRRLVCILILRRSAESICHELGVSAYRANIIAYAIALLSVRAKGRLPWSVIWAEQSVPTAVHKCLRLAIAACREVITKAAVSQSKNVTEFAKKEGCWKMVLEAPIELNVSEFVKFDRFSVADTAKPTHLVNVTQTFFKLSHQDWVKLSQRIEGLTKNTTYHGVTKTMAQNSLISKKPSDKQARILAKVLMRIRKDDSRLPIFSNLNDEDWKLIETTGG